MDDSLAPFSAEVELDLVIDDHRIELAQIAPSWIILRQGSEVEYPAHCHGEVITHIDGRRGMRRVTLVDGILPGSTEVKIVDR